MDLIKFVTQIAGKKATVALPWYRAGGIPAANCIGAYKAIGSPSLAASYVNLANPGTYDLTTAAEPTFDQSYGWYFNGSTMYLGTGIVPVNNQTWSMAIRYTDASGLLAGIDSPGANDFYLAYNVYYSSVNLLIKSPTKASGILMMCGVNAYRETTLEGTITAGSASNTRPIWIGAAGAATPLSFGVSKIQAIAIWNTDISAYQAEVHAAMAALEANP